MTTRQQWITWLLMVGAAFLAALGARWGIPIPPPPVITQPPDPPPAPPAPPTPPAPTPNALAAIVRISSGNVGCSATVIGPRRPDGRWWVLTASHCVSGTGQRWSMRFRDGRTSGFQVVNFDRRADWCWGVTDTDAADLPFALTADSTPAVGTKIWHAGYGIDVPGNREDGTITSGVLSDGKIQMRMSVSSGDSGGGIVIDSAGRIVSTVCCTSNVGGRGEVYGAAPESFNTGRRDTVSLDEWKPIPIPVREVPKEMPP
jgi:hypothetical protein